MIKVISFDIGGTLIKHLKDHSIVYQLSKLSNVNIDIVKQAYKEHFLTRQISIEDFSKKIKIGDVNEVIEIINQHYNTIPIAQVWDDVPSTLSEIKKLGIDIITISNKSYKNPYCLETYGLKSWVSKEIYSYEVGYSKPHIAIFRHVQLLLKLKPDEILHVGDSLKSDYFGAQNAGWNSVLLDRYRKMTSDKSISVIYSLNELLDYINEYYEGRR